MSIIQNAKVKTQNYNVEPKSDLRHRSYSFSLSVIHFLQNLPDTKIYWPVKDQLLRSATSVGANIVEAKASSSRRDFIHYYEIALKSANESQYWLCILRDGYKISPEQLVPLLQEISQIIHMLAASVLTLKKKKDT